ncbi:MAG: hypothetical protein Kow0031_40270 [Anaerolineae bacterium]
MPTMKPKISLLNPVVLPDNRRVTMEMIVDNLPGLSGGAANVISFFDTPPPSAAFGAGASGTAAQEPQPDYPNVVLSILDGGGHEVASLLIVEHREPRTSLTLHLRAPNPAEQYTARAEMSLNDEILEVVDVPFTLNPPPPAS